MIPITLERNEWNYILGLLGDRPWKESNALLMKMGGQLRKAERVGNGEFYAEGQEQREREYPKAASRRVQAQSGDSDRSE